MRSTEIAVGEAYTVKVPERLAIDHPMYTSAGESFTLTVTNVVGQAVIGIRPTSIVTIELTTEQAARLGLPPGRYVVEGMLSDATGTPVEAPLPDSVEHMVPARWLRP